MVIEVMVGRAVCKTIRHTKRIKVMAYFQWSNGKTLTEAELQELTGLTIGRPAMVARLKKASSVGIAVDTLNQQIAVLVAPATPATSSSAQSITEIPLDADANEARRLKTVREALFIDQKAQQAAIKTQLQRREVFSLDAIEPAWSAMVIAIREGLRGMIPTLVDRIMPLTDRDKAVDRAEAELARHLQRLSEFDLVRELNENEGVEEWQFTDNDLE